MAKTKISEFSSTPANNTDIDSINIAEGCAPSGINDAIRELMAQLKDFQTGAQGDSFNGPIGTSTAAAGAFTTLSATGAITSTLATGTAPLVIASTTKVSNLNVDLLDGADWASPAALGSTTPAAVSATTLSASSTVTLSGGTANGVAYLNGSKVVTSGSALTFDGTNFGTTGNANLGSGSKSTDTQLNFLADTGTQRIYIERGSRSLVFYDVGAAIENYRIAGITGIQSWGVGGSEAMRLTSTGLGIGTSSPSEKLAVAGSVTADIYKLRSNQSAPSSTDAFIYRPADNTIGFGTASAEKMRIDSSGNVGIGTSSPTQLLNVRKDQAAYTWSRTENQSSSASAYAGLMLGAFGNSWGLAIGSSAANSNALTFILDAGGSNAEKMRLDSSGNLGLGVTPSAWQTGANLKAFQVGVGAAFFSDTNSAYLGQNVYQNSVGTSLYINTNYASKYQQSSSVHSWHTAPSGTAGNTISFTQAMTLDASGNLLVGDTTASGRLTVKRGNDGNLAYFDGTTTQFRVDVSASTIYLNAQNGNGVMAFQTNGSERARIDSSGNLLVGTTSAAAKFNLSYAYPQDGARWTTDSTNTHTAITFVNPNGAVGTINTSSSSTSYNTSSDYRLKNTIAPMTGALAKVALLKPCTYKWNSNGSDGQGFIAHELAEVVPQCVTGEKDAVDADGNPQYQGIDTSFLVATLTAAIQELKAEFDAYKASHP